MRCVEDPFVLLADARQAVDVEEATVVELVHTISPMSKDVVLLRERLVNAAGVGTGAQGKAPIVISQPRTIAVGLDL